MTTARLARVRASRRPPRLDPSRAGARFGGRRGGLRRAARRARYRRPAQGPRSRGGEGQGSCGGAVRGLTTPLLGSRRAEGGHRYPACSTSGRGRSPGHRRLASYRGAIAERTAFVYLLRCGDTSLYCGWTFDLEQRLAAHRAGRGARYTRGRLPVALAGVIELPDAGSARREEARVKRLSREQKLALLAPAGPALQLAWRASES